MEHIFLLTLMTSVLRTWCGDITCPDVTEHFLEWQDTAPAVLDVEWGYSNVGTHFWPL